MMKETANCYGSNVNCVRYGHSKCSALQHRCESALCCFCCYSVTFSAGPETLLKVHLKSSSCLAAIKNCVCFYLVSILTTYESEMVIQMMLRTFLIKEKRKKKRSLNDKKKNGYFLLLFWFEAFDRVFDVRLNYDYISLMIRKLVWMINNYKLSK